MNVRRVVGMGVGLVALAGCATVSLNEAPIVDRRQAPAPVVNVPPTAVTQRTAPDGSYVVQRGDTLYSIALAFQQDFRDLARWNGLDDPARLQVGQVLRVTPPAGDVGGAVAVAAPIAGTRLPEGRPLEVTPLPPPGGAPAAPAPATATNAPAPRVAEAPAPVATAPSVAGVAAPSEAGAVSSPFGWAWPANGSVIDAFDATRTKGIGIAGKEGDPVRAAADGTVVYSGSTLRGYGNLIIVKHDEEFISAYAHNRQILVKQGQAVKRGERIAELGKSDTDRPKLHFEIRRGGKPVDPQLYLPRR